MGMNPHYDSDEDFRPDTTEPKTTYHCEGGRHEPREGILKFEDGRFISKCHHCEKRIWCSEIDTEYLDDTGELAFMSWELVFQ
jgi:hypothetical protein